MKEDIYRRVIKSNVMHGQKEDILFLPGVQKPGAKQGTVCQVEGIESFLLYPPRNLPLSLRQRKHTEVYHWKLYGQLGMNNLHGLSIYHPKCGSEYLMASDNVIQALLQRRAIQFPVELVDKRNVIERKLRFQLMKKP